MSNKIISIDGDNLNLENFVKIIRGRFKVGLAKSSIKRIKESRAMLDKFIKDDKIVYGITTGFGPMASVLIPTKYQSDLQQNLIRSHSANVGPIFSEEEVRASMLLRLNSIAKGVSAIRIETANLLKEFLNRNINPCVPQWGSVGASGDLTPSSHIALCLMGEGEVIYKGKRMKTKRALKIEGLNPILFKAKEGLALINGTTMMTGVGALQLADAWNLVRSAEVISTLSMSVLSAYVEPFHKRGHEVKAHLGQITVASNLRKLLAGCKLVVDEKRLKQIQNDLRKKMKNEKDVLESDVCVQDSYSLRAVPQILGAVRDALEYITRSITIEMNSANDNPLFFTDLKMSYQGANFHGQTVALPLDVLAISLTEIAVISERRLNKMLDSARNKGLSPFLAGDKFGLRCGFEGAQYIPTSLVAECCTMCNPASVHSISSNAGNQDVVSMGLVAARKARDIREKVEYVLAVELLAACQGMEECDKSKLNLVLSNVYKKVRKLVPAYNKDRVLSSDFEKIKDFLHDGKLVEIVKNKISDLE